MHRQTITITVDMTSEAMGRANEGIDDAEASATAHGAEPLTPDHRDAMLRICNAAMIISWIDSAMESAIGVSRDNPPKPDYESAPMMVVEPEGILRDGTRESLGIKASVTFGPFETVN